MIDIVKLSGRKKDKLIQFAKNLEDIPEKKLKFPMLWSQKMDGVYCLALKMDGKVTIYSRTGEVYTSMKHLEEELDKYMCPKDIIIFEAYSYATRKQSKISGWVRDTKEQHPELLGVCNTFICWDDFLGKKVIPYLEGYRILNKILNGCDKTKLVIAYQEVVNSLEEAMTKAQLIWTHGGEGIVLRNPDAYWQGGKRNEDMIKIKEKITLDLEVIGVFVGKGKYAGMLGGITCRYADDKVVEVGSGFTDSQRFDFWNDQESIIGKIVEVEAMKESDKGKLREPRFKGIRFDKTKGDF